MHMNNKNKQYNNMKLYEKIIDGKQYCKPANKIVIVKDGYQIFNPTEDMFLEDGWVEYVEPAISYTLEEEKEFKAEEILAYDSSDDINIFYVNDMPIWLDKATRSGLMLRLQAEEKLGKTKTTLWYGARQFEIPIEQAFQMLYALEIYASECYDNTHRHLANIEGLATIEEVESYNYMTGYPNKLEF